MSRQALVPNGVQRFAAQRRTSSCFGLNAVFTVRSQPRGRPLWPGRGQSLSIAVASAVPARHRARLDQRLSSARLTRPARRGLASTLLQHLCGKERRYATLDDPTLRPLAIEDPALFVQRFEPPVLIDEIRYAPQLSTAASSDCQARSAQ